MSTQSMDALQIANTRRLAGAELKRDLAAGTISLEDALNDPRAQSLTLGRLLMTQRRWGLQRTKALLRNLQISEMTRVTALTERQRTRICEASRGVIHREWAA